MIRIRAILSFLTTLLFIALAMSSDALHLPAASADSTFQAFATQNAGSKLSTAIERQEIKNVTHLKIKVRYINGECSFYGAYLPFSLSEHYSFLSKSDFPLISLTLAGTGHVHALRGPPGAQV